MKRNKGRWMRAAAMLLTLVLLMGTFYGLRQLRGCTDYRRHVRSGHIRGRG